MKKGVVMLDSFALESREEAERFDALLSRWQTSRKGVGVQGLRLAEVWDLVQDNREGGRIFASVLDLKLNLALLPIDLIEIADVLNKDIAENRQPTDSILQDPEHFMERLDLLRAGLDFILRYRAVWDKIMGLVVLLTTPDDYQRFLEASSRRSAFRKIAEEAGRIPREFVDRVEALVKKFDDEYRTAEAHGSGRMRKWSLVVQLEEYNPNEMLIWAWNDLNELLQHVSKFLVVGDAEPTI